MQSIRKLLCVLSFLLAVAPLQAGIRGSNIQSATTGSTTTVTWPTGTLSGDLVEIMIGSGYNVTIPTGWTQDFRQTATVWNTTAIHKVMTSGDITAGSVTITLSGSFDHIESAVDFVGNPGVIREVDENGGSGASGASYLFTATSSAPTSTDLVLNFASARISGGTRTNAYKLGSSLQFTDDRSNAWGGVAAISSVWTSPFTQTVTYGGGVGTTSSLLIVVEGAGTAPTMTAMPKIPIIQSHSVTGLSAAFRNNVTNGDLILVVASWASATATPTISDTLSTSFSQALLSTSASQKYVVFIGTATSSGADTVAIVETSASVPIMTITELPPYWTSMVDASASNSTLTVTSTGATQLVASTQSVTTTVNSDLVLSLAVLQNAGTALGTEPATVGQNYFLGQLVNAANSATLASQIVVPFTPQAIFDTFSNATNTIGSSAIIAFRPTSGIRILSPASIPGGSSSNAYSYTLLAMGGSAAYTWSITSGSLPSGLSLNSSTGVISGTTTVTGTSAITFHVTDGRSTADLNATLVIASSAKTISYVQGATNSSTTQATFSSSVTSGDLIYVVADDVVSGISDVLECADSLGTPLNYIGEVAVGGPSSTDKTRFIYAYAGIAPSSGADTVTCTGVRSIAEIQNAAYFGSDNMLATRGSSSSPISSGSLTTLVPNEIVVAVAEGYTPATSLSVSSPFTAIGSATNSAAGYDVISTITGYTASFTMTGNTDGRWAILLMGFRPTAVPLPPPNITSLSPSAGSAGTSVTITGTSFGSTQGTSTVTFNGTAATTTSWSDTSIVTMVPSGATTGNVVVSVGGVNSSGSSFTVVSAPSITSLSPAMGAVGAAVTITGTNFGATQGTSAVLVNGVAATPTSWSATSIAVLVPSGATTGNVVVTVSGVASNGSSFTVVPVPNITSLSVTSGAVGAAVTITGTNFGSTQASGTVSFNGTAATVTSWSATNVATTVPSGATTGNVVVFASGVNSNGSSFTVVPVPSIASVSPAWGPVGTSVTISGSGFGSTQGASTVQFNITMATPTSWSDTSITVPVPAGAATGNLVVTTAGTSSDGEHFIVGTLSSLAVSPQTSTILIANSQQFTATGTYSDGSNQDLTNALSWNSSNLSVATINGSGLATAIGAGQTTIQAAVGSISSYATLIVAATESLTGSMNRGKSQHTATLLNNGLVLVAGDRGASYNGVGQLLYSSVTGTFTLTGEMNQPRFLHTATLLNNGLVLITGGQSSITYNILASAELYDPATGTFTTTGSMSSARSGHTATLLNNGLVLIAGGNDPFSALASAELYDPTTGVFTATGSMNAARSFHTATLLNNGMVLIAGLVAHAELYNPATGSFTMGGSMNIPRSLHRATLLNNGLVLLTGGHDINFNDPVQSELYDQATGAFTNTADLNTARVYHTATLLKNGTVLIAGGATSSGDTNKAELYAPYSLTPIGLTSIALNPTSPSFPVAISQNFTAIGTFIDNSTEVLSSVLWTSSDQTVATITNDSSNYGHAFGAAQGSATISACAGSICGSTTATVTPAQTYISNLSANSGAIGSVIAITGGYFGATQTNSTVTFNGASATVTSWTTTNIVATVPAGATNGAVVVTVGGVASNGVNFTVLPAPSVTSLSPTSGFVGTLVTITGINLGGTGGYGNVFFNGVPATATSWSSTSITVLVPQTATTGNVVVHASGVDSNAIAFTVLAPTIGSLSPAIGPVGTVVTITGSFGGSGAVFFTGSGAEITSWSATSIVVSVPTFATTGNVIVVEGLTSNGVNFTVTPAITSLLPPLGAVGSSVTITGTAFGWDQGSSTVTFNGTPAIATSWSDNSIVAVVPSGATTGNIVVNVGGTTSNGASFQVISQAMSLSPSSGSVGSVVTISAPSGISFGDAQGASTVSFNGVIATPTSWGIQSIIVPVPVGATTGPVIVNVGSTYGANFTVSPGITNISPSSGAVGTSVTVSGTNFGSTQGSSVVAFNGVPALPTSWNNTTIVVPLPSAATTGSIQVTVNGSTSNGVLFTVAPSILSLAPQAGPVGTLVTLLGSNFGAAQGTSTISFAGVAATPTNWSPSRIIVPVPSGAITGSVVVTVGGQISNGITFSLGSGSLTGTISRASDGSAVSGASVQALQSNSVKSSTTTASDGTYTLSNLLPGIYDLSVSASGLGTAIMTGNSVVVSTPTTVNVSLSAAGTISGKVMQTDGATPISGATVRALQANDTAGSSTTDGTGSYQISNLSALSYTVQASAAGFTAQTQPNISVTVGNTTTTNFNLSGQSAITYQYDALGRLIGVVDSIKGAAAYSYDAVGNLQAITRANPGQVSIVGFTPGSGAVGATVTINGASFNSTPSQNTVSFNGANATVISASPSQIVCTVPPGANNGPITVTTPAGSAASVSSFTVSTFVLSPVTLTITTAGQNVTKAFNGTSGQPATVWLTSNSIGTMIVQLLDPNGNVVTSAYNSSSNFTLPSVTFSATGSYTISVQPQSTATGSVTVSVTTP